MVRYTIVRSSLDRSDVVTFKKISNFSRMDIPAEVAQLVEQWSEEPCVASSILALGTERL